MYIDEKVQLEYVEAFANMRADAMQCGIVDADAIIQQKAAYGRIAIREFDVKRNVQKPHAANRSTTALVSMRTHSLRSTVCRSGESTFLNPSYVSVFKPRNSSIVRRY